MDIATLRGRLFSNFNRNFRILSRLLLIFSVVLTTCVPYAFATSASSASGPPSAFQVTPDVSLSRITGTFIQYQSWMMQLDEKQWNLELSSMQSAGIDTIIIQWLKSDKFRFFPVRAQGNDPTEIILKFADSHHIKVVLGTQFDKNWWNSWDDSDFQAKALREGSSFAKSVLKRYKSHPSFVGWYIPYELGDFDFDDDELRGLKTFLHNYAANLHQLSARKYQILASTFFEGKLSPSAVQDTYSQILKSSGIDIVMIQDGVGARNWTTPLADKLVPYFAAFRRAAGINHIRTWSVVESFSNGKDVNGVPQKRPPAEISRLNEQLAVQATIHPEKTITFDFFHYMSPFRGEQQKLLFQNYVKEIGK